MRTPVKGAQAAGTIENVWVGRNAIYISVSGNQVLAFEQEWGSGDNEVEIVQVTDLWTISDKGAERWKRRSDKVGIKYRSEEERLQYHVKCYQSLLDSGMATYQDVLDHIASLGRDEAKRKREEKAAALASSSAKRRELYDSLRKEFDDE